jgi:hypothetical protein
MICTVGHLSCGSYFRNHHGTGLNLFCSVYWIILCNDPIYMIQHMQYFFLFHYKCTYSNGSCGIICRLIHKLAAHTIQSVCRPIMTQHKGILAHTQIPVWRAQEWGNTSNVFIISTLTEFLQVTCQCLWFLGDQHDVGGVAKITLASIFQ